MGRLQKKKPLSKKKKTKVNVDSSVKNVAGEKNERKIVALTDFPRDKKKQDLPRKKVQGGAVQPGKLDSIKQFLREVKVELKKVTWPSRAQTLGSTAVVLVVVIIISLFLGLVDLGLKNLVRLVLQ